MTLAWTTTGASPSFRTVMAAVLAPLPRSTRIGFTWNEPASAVAEMNTSDANAAKTEGRSLRIADSLMVPVLSAAAFRGAKSAEATAAAGPAATDRSSARIAMQAQQPLGRAPGALSSWEVSASRPIARRKRVGRYRPRALPAGQKFTVA